MIRTALPLCLTLLTVLPAFAQHEQAVSDAARVNAAYTKYSTNEYRQLFRPGHFGTEFDEKVAGYRAHLEQIEAFEETDIPKLNQLLSAFQERYGADRAAIRKSFQEINSAGGSVPGDPAYSWEELKKTVAAPAETRRKMAAELLQLGGKGGQTHQGYNIMTIEESYAQAKAYLELAVAYHPDHAEAQQKLAAIDDAQAEHVAANAKAIDEAEFGDHSEHYQGPDTAAEMAALATEYLSKKESGKDGKLLALRIAGDWQVADQNILGDTLTWGLPVEVAYRQDDDPKTAKVVSVELITRDNEQKPPFQRHRFFESRYVRVANLPGGVADDTASGGFGLLRIPLAVLLLALGFVAAAPMIVSRIPAMATVVAKVQPFAPMIGVAALALGILAILFSILSPLRDFLPQAAAVVVGLLVGLDILVKRTSRPATGEPTDEKEQDGDAGGDGLKGKANKTIGKAGDAAKHAVIKAQDLLIERQGTIRRLDAIRGPLGIACFVLGLLHLFVGGFILI